MILPDILLLIPVVLFLCYRYAFQIVLQTRDTLRALPSLVDINVPNGKHFTVCGDVHGQVCMLLTELRAYFCILPTYCRVCILRFGKLMYVSALMKIFLTVHTLVLFLSKNQDLCKTQMNLETYVAFCEDFLSTGIFICFYGKWWDYSWMQFAHLIMWPFMSLKAMSWYLWSDKTICVTVLKWKASDEQKFRRVRWLKNLSYIFLKHFSWGQCHFHMKIYSLSCFIISVDPIQLN